MRKTHEKKLKGPGGAEVRYRCTTLPARKGLRLGTRIVRIVAPSLGILAGEGQQSVATLLTGKGSGIIGQAIEALVSRLDEDGVLDLVKDLLECTVRFGPDETGKPQQENLEDGDVFDEVYAGNYEEMLEALRFAFEVNLPVFFGKGRIGQAFKKALATADTLLSSQESETP